MEIVRQPTINDVRRVALEKRSMVFRYGSTKNSVVVTPEACQAIMDAYNSKKTLTVEKDKIARMAKSSSCDFTKLCKFYGVAPRVPVTAMPRASRRHIESLKDWHG